MEIIFSEKAQEDIGYWKLSGKQKAKAKTTVTNTTFSHLSQSISTPYKPHLTKHTAPA